jgi:RNA polymerase sigma factor (sigma-70 family)
VSPQERSQRFLRGMESIFELRRAGKRHRAAAGRFLVLLASRHGQILSKLGGDFRACVRPSLTLRSARILNPERADPDSTAGAGGKFPPTLWSVVLAAGGESSPQAEKALTALCNAYWKPIYVFLRRRGCSSHDAEDFTQAFFVHLIERHKLGHARPERGRFRTFLLAALNNLVADELSKTRAKKRGGGAIISMDATALEAQCQAEHTGLFEPEKVFDRRWAASLIEGVLQRLELECKATGKQERFEVLRMYLIGDPDGEGYREAGRRLGMTTGAVKVAVLRLRQRYRELFREAVAETVSDPGNVDEEVRHILAALSQ